MNKSLQKKVKIYAGVAGAILAADKASGQIVYHDVVPDDTLGSLHRFFDYDINADSINDFTFLYYDHVYVNNNSSAHVDVALELIGNSNQKIFVGSKNGCHYFQYMYDVKMLSSSALIAPPNQVNSFFDNGKIESWFSDFTSQNGYTPGCFFAVSLLGNDKFAGLKLNINGQQYYGWIRLGIRFKHLIIKDYAYNTIPNTPIMAGDTTNASLGVNELNSGFQITQHNNLIQILSSQSTNNSAVSVFDLLGKEVLTKSFSGVQTEISIDRKGIYFVEIISKKGNLRKKIFVY